MSRIKSYKEFNESVKYPESLLNYAKKFKSPEELLRSGGFTTDDLDKAAYGFTDALNEIDPKDLHIKWKDDYDNVKWEVKQSGLTPKQWSEKISLEEPIDVFYKNGKFWIDDGHHRYFAAKTLGKKLKMNLDIRDNVIKALGSNDYDQYHKDVWNKANEAISFSNDEDRWTIKGEDKSYAITEICFEPYQYEFSGVCSYEKFEKFLEDKPSIKIESLDAGENVRRGNGTELMTGLIKHFEDLGYDQFLLNASPIGIRIKLLNLIKFYEKFGFRVVQHQGNNAMMARSEKTLYTPTYKDPVDAVYYTYDKDPESWNK